MSKTKNESIRKTYEAINELVRFADTKATAILATDGIIAGFLFTNVSLVQGILQQKPYTLAFIIPPILFLLVSSIAAAYCVAPRLKQNKSKCLIFFCDIANYSSAEEYGKALKNELTDEKIENQLIDQVWANSRIAVKKYNAVKVSTLAFVALLISIVVFIFAASWS